MFRCIFETHFLGGILLFSSRATGKPEHPQGSNGLTAKLLSAYGLQE